MKHLKHLFTALLLLLSVAVNAQDFDVRGIYYKITDATNKTVAVTYKSISYIGYANQYTGSVVIPQSVTYNGSTYSVTSIGYKAFYNCTRLTSVVIPNSVTSIGNHAFYNCYGLTSVVIPNSVTSIGESAFEYCSGLKSVTIGNSVTSIGDDAFYYCTGLTSVTIGNSVTSIGNEAFYNCSRLTSIVIPNSVTSIGNDAFNDCSGLTSVTIGNSVTGIGNSAFNDCTSLKELRIEDGTETLSLGYSSSSDGLFYDCPIETLYLGRNLSYSSSYGYSPFCENKTLTSVTIGNSVTSIGSSAFSGCTRLGSVTIGNSVTSIGYSAFYKCTSLTSIEIPGSVTSIGQAAFSVCSGLKSVTIGNSVTSIGSYAFYGCTGLTSIEIPNNVTSIGESAFYRCTGLTGLTSHIPADKLFVPGSYAFDNINKTQCTLYVPYGAKEAYASTDGWNGFENIVEMDLTGIDEVLDEVKVENGEVKTVYDLNGRVVENPSNGIYIINGKKVLVK